MFFITIMPSVEIFLSSWFSVSVRLLRMITINVYYCTLHNKVLPKVFARLQITFDTHLAQQDVAIPFAKSVSYRGNHVAEGLRGLSQLNHASLLVS